MIVLAWEIAGRPQKDKMKRTADMVIKTIRQRLWGRKHTEFRKHADVDGVWKNAFSVCDSVFINVFQRKRTSIAPTPPPPPGGEECVTGPKNGCVGGYNLSHNSLKHPVPPFSVDQSKTFWCQCQTQHWKGEGEAHLPNCFKVCGWDCSLSVDMALNSILFP